MTTREVDLDGGSPWGFRLHGGADLNQPLRVSRVNPGSKAALRGIREGDLITSINGQSTKNISNAEAHSILKKSGDTLKLGLNEDCNGGSPKRRQYKTVHQETHSETIKKSSITSYTSYTSKTESNNELIANENIKTNGESKNLSHNTENLNHQPPQLSTSTSSSSTLTYTEGGSIEDMADNGTTRSRRRRSRNNRKKQANKTQTAQILLTTKQCDNNNKVEIEPILTNNNEPQQLPITTTTDKVVSDYSVEFPGSEGKREKTPKISTKSKSLDDDEMVKIQELSEVSESEEKTDNKAIVVEAESDLENEKKIKSPTLSLELLEEPLLDQPLISPEEELTLRNFLEGLNLINSPEDAVKECNEKSTPESIKVKKAQKRQALEQYFMPMVQNPRYLEVINEESSDLSDRESMNFTKHLKQGTPELEPRLVGAKILDAPLDDSVVSAKVETKSEAEIVYLDSSPEDDECEVESETVEAKLSGDILLQLTPPPTPDNISPKNEDSDFIKNHTSEINIKHCRQQQLPQEIDEGLKETSQSSDGNESSTTKKDDENLNNDKKVNVQTTTNEEDVKLNSLDIINDKPRQNKSTSREIRVVEVKYTKKTNTPPTEQPAVKIKDITNNDSESFLSKSKNSKLTTDTDDSNKTPQSDLKSESIAIEKSVNKDNNLDSFNQIHDSIKYNINSENRISKMTEELYLNKNEKKELIENFDSKIGKEKKYSIESEIKSKTFEQSKNSEISKTNNAITDSKESKTQTVNNILNLNEPANNSKYTFYEKDISSKNTSFSIKKLREEYFNSILDTKSSKTRSSEEKVSKALLNSIQDYNCKVKSVLSENKISSEKIAHNEHKSSLENFDQKEAPVPPRRKSSVLRMSQTFPNSINEHAEETTKPLNKNLSGSKEFIIPIVKEIETNPNSKNETVQSFVKSEQNTEFSESSLNKELSRSKEVLIPINIEKEDKLRSSNSISGFESSIKTEVLKEEISKSELKKLETFSTSKNSKETFQVKETNIPIAKDEKSSEIKIPIIIEKKTETTQNEDKEKEKKEVIIPVVIEKEHVINNESLSKPKPETQGKETIIQTSVENKENIFRRSSTKLEENTSKHTSMKSEHTEMNSSIKENKETHNKKEVIIPIIRETSKSKECSFKESNIAENVSANKKEFIVPIKILEEATENESQTKDINKKTPDKEFIIPVKRETEQNSESNEEKGTTEVLYSNAVSLPSSPKSLSSSDSSRTSPCTAKYNPNSSVADINSIEDLFKKFQPLTLRELCLNYLIAQPFGTDILQELADVSMSIEAVTSKLALNNPSFTAQTKWTGLPCDENPKIVVCLSPTQKEELEKSKKIEKEGEKLLDLHQKFHERFRSSDENNDNRLLKIIRGDLNRRSPSMPNILEEVNNEDLDKNARLKAKDLSEWLQLARGKSCMNLHSTNSMPRPGNNNTNMQRRTSLPQEFYQRQMQYLLEKEKEIQRELEYLEEEKRKITVEMTPTRQFHAEDFRISKRGDFAEKKSRPLSMPITSETFRQQMYEEYMDKIQKKEERKNLKVIKVSMSKQELTDPTVKPEGIAEEFMDKVKEKQKMGKLNRLKGQKSDAESKTDDEFEPVLVMDGNSLTGTKKLPKHLQEFVNLTKQASENDGDGRCQRKCCKDARRIMRALKRNRHQGATDTLLHEIDSALVLAKGFLLRRGVWSPGQKQRLPPKTLDTKKEFDKKDEPISPVWTPKSAQSSPIVERKEFKPVKFESPVLSRKNSQEDSKEPPWKAPPTNSETVNVASNTLQKRLPTSHSAPVSGFSDFHRLPKAQNPTITLLQKAREGQLPRGASYIEQEPNYYPRRPINERPSHIGPGEILYQIKNEYTSESDSEKPRKMVDLGPRKFEGIGPTTKEGMPLVLRSEVKDANQSKWYKKMYETIHKQRPHKDEYVTVRYKQRRGNYPYSSGYLSEPEPGSYDSDVTDYKYATLDRRRPPIQNKENTTPMSSTLPRNITTKSSSTSEILKQANDNYNRNQPGRIENYIPGHSSISEKEAKEWWDEVMDIFDGWLDYNSALPSYEYMFTRALARSHLEQQKRGPQGKSFINQALKESGYESDSTLVFRRKEDSAQTPLSPQEQKEVYKQIQKGGDVPLHGLRKPAPERPKEEAELEYFPLSPTLTRIHVKPPKEIFCYPVTVHYNQPPKCTFGDYKRTAPSSPSAIPRPLPPSPPKRRSSRNNSTLRFISTMKVKTDKLPLCKRHETCFTSTSNINNTKVKYLRDKISCKLSTDSKKKTESTVKPKLKISKVVSTSPQSKVVSTIATGKNEKIESKTVISKCVCTSRLKKCKKCSTLKPNTFGIEKKKINLDLPKKTATLVNSPPLLSPTEVKKAVQKSSPYVYKKSNGPIVSSKTGATLPIKVGMNKNGKTIIKSSITRPKSPPLKPIEKKSISTIGRCLIRPKTKLIEKKLKKSKKDEINGEIVKKEIKPISTTEPELEKTIKNQKESIQSDYFFQHLFLRDLSPTPSTSSRNSWLLERAFQLQRRRTSNSEPSIGAMKVYLKHTKPVTDSKFKTLDQARSRSASPKSVTWESMPEKRSSSLPPKLHFSQTSRPVSPKIERRTPPLPRSPSCRKIMQYRNYPSQDYTYKIDRSRSADRIESLYSSPSHGQSISSLDSCESRDYNNYIRDLLISSRRSSRFKELNDFYSTIEKLGRLELTTSSIDLKPRRKYEDEIIDYDRWQEVRIRERAERELQLLYHQLKENEKEKGFLYRSREPGRWRRELDRGLRIKEKSVDDIKKEFEKIQKGEKSSNKLTYFKDTYKPLWRGDSVINLANKMVERRSHSEGRVSCRKKLIDSECMLTHGIGSKLWSSLSMEQVNILKTQLSEIYSQNTNHKVDYSIEVPEKKYYKPTLSVRRNSDSSDIYSNKSVDFGMMSKSMPESDKKILSQTISREAMDHIRKKNVLPLVLAKETRGAIAAAEANIKPLSKSSMDNLKYESEPETALVKTDALTPQKISSTSETDSTDDSSKTVINVGKKEEIKKIVQYFESTSKSEYSPTIYKAADDEGSIKSEKPLSQSYQDLKELFGERDIARFATLPLSATRKQQFTYSDKPKLRAISPPRTISAATSFDSVYRSRSLSPLPDESLALVKAGEVQRLKNQFDRPRRCKSDSSLSTSSVDALRRKYEYPVYAGRGRSRVRRGVVSPTFLRAEDRFMPHINIISKIATLYTNKDSKQNKTSRSTEELAQILGCPVGEVEKLRSYFDKNLSLLGRMYTSSPNIKELRDISPYLAASWIAHRYPRCEDNTRSLSSPESNRGSRDVSILRKDRPKSVSPSPSKKSSILKQEVKKSQRYQPEPVRYRSWWTSPTYPRPSVSFQEPEPPVPPPKGHHGLRYHQQESPRKYVENEVTIHYKTPVRQEIKEYLSEDELAYRQAEAMKKIYQEERRRKYLQVSKSLQELQDANSRRHTDNFIPSQKSPIPLNRYDDFEADLSPPVKPRPRSPEPRLIARALYNFVGQTARELTFRKGDLIHIRRQVDKNWYEGEFNAMVGLFPANYVEILPYDTAKITPRKSHEGQARAKYNFVAQTHLELSLAKGELVVITRRVDDNWFEGKIGGRKGIFPVSYVDVLIDPSDPPPPPTNSKPVASPAAHSLLLNGSAGGKESMGSHTYTPRLAPSYHAKPVQITNNYGSLNKSPVNQALHVETQSEPVAYRALYKYLPQNDDELELLEGDTVFVLEKCDDGWYVGSSERTGAFGTFPGNYVEKI